ncbi:putative membrane protein [Variovorax boronicumulans]|uniref:hypothetical protein n=1 Tax=Variovorax boronicumulans TaxID=436515 RepID=UPI00277EA82C|nr:hypothetical protein [Variovorax boronicumulans]MDQ0015392.1 putative membrane protein [Variovorax boronicumulans]
MMKVTVNQIVDVIAMGNGFVAAVGSVSMARLMPGAAMVWRALVGILGGYFERVFIHVAFMQVVQMAVVQVVDVVTMGNGGVAARRPVLVRMFAGVL